MIIRFFLLLFFVFSISHVFSQTLIGKWRRVNPELSIQDTLNKKLQWGDIEIRSDSTFHIEGDSSKVNADMAGWYLGAEFNGKWEMPENKRLTLWIDTGPHKMFLNYIIIKMDDNNLVLRSLIDKKDKKHNLKYVRL